MTATQSSGGAFSFSHPGLCRLFSNWFVWENADPDTASPFDESGHGNSCRLDLTSGQPTTFDGLKSEITEVERDSHGRRRLSSFLFVVFDILFFSAST